MTPNHCRGHVPRFSVSRALIINTGQVSLAYTAEPMWSGTYPPGVQFGDPMELSGVRLDW